MLNLKENEFWFIVGSQDLYGEDALKKVEEHSVKMADYFSSHPLLPCRVVLKPVAKSPSGIRKLFEEANADRVCAGIITGCILSRLQNVDSRA